MKVSDATWQEIESFSREGLIILPTGSIEQHGPHLPLATDTLLVTAVAEAIEKSLRANVLLLPTVWLGASQFHDTFPGTVSANTATYVQTVNQIVDSYRSHRFRKFLILNGHGDNQEPNRIALREAKKVSPNLVLAEMNYFSAIEDKVAKILTGPLKQMGHGCEIETSLMLYVHPGLVRMEKAIDDGLDPTPSLPSLVLTAAETSDQGTYGYATHATAEKGSKIFEMAVESSILQCEALLNGFVMRSIQE